MTTETLVIMGKRIYLRDISKDDYKNSSEWLNDMETTRWMQKSRPYTTDDIYAYHNSMKNPSLYLAICLKDGKHIGNLSYIDHMMAGYFSDVSIVIGDKEQWGKGYASEAISLLSDYIFIKRDIHKLRAGACVENMGCIKAFTKAGFIIEGTEKEAVYCDGEWRDIAVMGLLKKDWEAIR